MCNSAVDVALQKDLMHPIFKKRGCRVERRMTITSMCFTLRNETGPEVEQVNHHVGARFLT